MPSSPKRSLGSKWRPIDATSSRWLRAPTKWRSDHNGAPVMLMGAACAFSHQPRTSSGAASLNVHNCSNLWCPWSDDCKGILNNYCASTDNISGLTCELFCSKVENKALCNPAMCEYCTSVALPSNPLCTCILAKKEGVPAPLYFSAPCTSCSYQTLNHVSFLSMACTALYL
jgi:hypothetical protein